MDVPFIQEVSAPEKFPGLSRNGPHQDSTTQTTLAKIKATYGVASFAEPSAISKFTALSIAVFPYFLAPLPDFIPGRTRYESVNYGIRNVWD